jgi:hypothetical protein
LNPIIDSFINKGNIIMKGFIITLITALTLSACSICKEKLSPDVLSLYRELTSIKTLLQARTGEPTQFSGSEKNCITATCNQGDTDCKPTDHYNGSPLMAGSDYRKYYELTTGEDGYALYDRNSAYALDIAELTADLNRLMESFERTGLRDELRRRGLVPALMFDIDNTLEFSAATDSDDKGDGPAIRGMVEFADRWCFKDDLVCYFVTARNCDASSVAPTEKWLKKNLHLSDEQVSRYTHFSRNTQSLTCTVPGNPVVAYKDVIREALEQEQKIFWLMSIGDQLTDSLGEHSGMKIRVPNQFFHSDIVPNQYAPWGAGQCGSPQTIAPPPACAEVLRDHAIEVSSLEYCRKQPASK